MSPTQLVLTKVLVHPDIHHLRLFNLQIDGVTVLSNTNGGSTVQTVSPGNHKVAETGGTGTPLSAFATVIGGSCAADGTVNLAVGDTKSCTITNYDHAGGCTVQRPICCEPGDGQNGCLKCIGWAMSVRESRDDDCREVRVFRQNSHQSDDLHRGPYFAADTTHPCSHEAIE